MTVRVLAEVGAHLPLRLRAPNGSGPAGLVFCVRPIGVNQLVSPEWHVRNDEWSPIQSKPAGSLRFGDAFHSNYSEWDHNSTPSFLSAAQMTQMTQMVPRFQPARAFITDETRSKIWERSIYHAYARAAYKGRRMRWKEALTSSG